MRAVPLIVSSWVWLKVVVVVWLGMVLAKTALEICLSAKLMK